MGKYNLPYIIAVDFDGTLVEDKFPDIGTPRAEIIQAIKAHKSSGTKIILWTCRNGKALHDARMFCKGLGLEFDEVNRNLPEVQKMFGNTDTRKVYANEYWDDKSVIVGYLGDKALVVGPKEISAI